MKYPEFKLETYFATREFSAPYNLCASDVETHTMNEVLQMADEETLGLWNQLELNYTEPKGLPELLREISYIYGPNISDENVLCFAGAEEGIYCMAQVLLKPTDHAIVITPCYQSLESLPASICSITKVSLKFQEQWKIDINAIKEAIKPNTKLLVINFPHNPSGALIAKEEQKELIQLARKHDLWIFSDEVYRLLEFNITDRLMPIASVYEKGISLSVMSKAYGLAGLRIGWVACQQTEILDAMGELKHYLSICNSAPSEVLALIALRASDKIHSRNHTLLLNNFELLKNFFKTYSGLFEWIQPKAGCIGYPLFKGRQSVDRFADELLDDFGVLILPSSVYDEAGNHFRIGFGRKTLPESLGQLSRFIEKNLSSL